MKISVFFAAILSVFIPAHSAISSNVRHFYEDRPFVQDFAEKIPLANELSDIELSAVRTDRNGRILVVSDKGLLQIHNGKLVPDRLYRPIQDMLIKNLRTYRNQFVYLTDKAVLSNAWAGKFYTGHKIPDAGLFEMGSNFDFILAGGNLAAYYNQNKCAAQWKTADSPVKQILFEPVGNRFILLSGDRLDCFSPGKEVTKVFEGRNLNCMDFNSDNTALIIGEFRNM